MKHSIAMIFVSLTAYGLSSSAQQPTAWTSPYFYYHYNAPLDLPTQKVSADEKAGNQQQLFTNYNDHSMQNMLGSHVVLLTTCLRDLKTTKADLVHTNSEVETVKKELNKLKDTQLNSTSNQLLANVMAMVESMKKEMTGMITKTDLMAQTTQRLDETHTSRVESVKKELSNVMTKVENVNTALDLKADKTALDLKAEITALDLKADKTALDLKADKTALDLKADKTALDLKAEKLALDLKADITALDLKADITALDLKADKTALDLKADKTALDLKADKTALDLKADKTVMQTALDSKADKTALNPINTALNSITTPSSIGKIPNSCGDLQQIGHKKSGLYSIMGSKQVENVYCDFTKPTGDAGLQKWIGYANVKSTLVYFYALRNSAFDQANVPIPFQSEKINIGGGMNLSTGKFTAPVKGVYFFSFTGLAGFSSTSQATALKIAFYLNGNYLSTAEVGEANTPGHSSTLTMQSTLNMQKGDQIWLQIWSISPGVRLWDSNHHHNHFTGFLLQEEMSVSL